MAGRAVGGDRAGSARWLHALAIALLVLGTALVVYAGVFGGAQVALVLVVPVIYGRSPALVGGALCLFAGIALFGWSRTETAEPLPPGAAIAPDGDDRPSAVGGVVLVGPVPLFFGAWRDVPSWVRWTVAGVAAVLIAVAVLLAVRGV